MNIQIRAIKNHPGKNQQGSVIALALMVMVILTLAGLAAINDTVMESTIARNHADARRALYLAEAAVRQGIQVLEDAKDDTNGSVLLTISNPANYVGISWLQPRSFDFITNTDFGDFVSGDFGDFHQLLGNEPGVDLASGFLIKLFYADPMISQGMQTYDFHVYGRAIADAGAEAIVKVMYRIRIPV